MEYLCLIGPVELHQACRALMVFSGEFFQVRTRTKRDSQIIFGGRDQQQVIITECNALLGTYWRKWSWRYLGLLPVGSKLIQESSSGSAWESQMVLLLASGGTAITNTGSSGRGRIRMLCFTWISLQTCFHLACLYLGFLSFDPVNKTIPDPRSNWRGVLRQKAIFTYKKDWCHEERWGPS